jgi:hypothetical protein
MSHLPTARGFQGASFKVQDAGSEFQWWYILKSKRISRDISDNATTHISGFSLPHLRVLGVLAVQSRF